MKKRISVIIEGENQSINYFLEHHLSALHLSSASNFSIICINGLENFHNKTAFNILLLPVFDETNLLQNLKQLKDTHKDFKIILYTNFTQGDFICELYEEGIDGHISAKDNPEEFARAIESVVAQEKFHSHCTNTIVAEYYSKSRIKKVPTAYDTLTEMEKVVFKNLCNGMSSPKLAEILFKSVRTIDGHRGNIYKKIGVNNISELQIWAHQNNFDFDIKLLPKKRKPK